MAQAAAATAPGSPDDNNCKNFRKPNVSSADPKHRVLYPALAKLSHSVAAAGTGCEFVIEMTMDSEAHSQAGAPAKIVTAVTISELFVSWDMVQVNKRPTRLPEAGFFTFNPLAAALAPEGYRLQILGSPDVSPTDVVGAGGNGQNTSTYGGSPHLVGLEAITWAPPTVGTSAFRINITSLDVSIVSVGVATPFPSPRTVAPDMTAGASFNIFQNIWNTNYVLCKLSIMLFVVTTPTHQESTALIRRSC